MNEEICAGRNKKKKKKQKQKDLIGTHLEWERVKE